MTHKYEESSKGKSYNLEAVVNLLFLPLLIIQVRNLLSTNTGDGFSKFRNQVEKLDPFSGLL